MTGVAAARGRPLRVAYALDSLDLGGTELNAVRTLERIDRARVEPFLVCGRPDGALRSRVDAAGVPIERLALTSLKNASVIGAARQVVSFLRRNRIDVLHAHDVYSNILCVPCARLAGVPMVIASRRWWTVTERPSQRTANRLAYRFAHRVLANAPSIGRMLVEQEGVPPHRVLVVPNFVEDAAFAPLASEDARAIRESLGAEGRTPLVGIVANLSPVKDHATLLRAVARIAGEFPGLGVVLVGDGVRRAELEQQASALGLSKVVAFAGQRPHRAGLQGAFDVVVLCSKEEGFPNAVVEGMAAGRPVVASRVGGILDAVVEGETGLLFPPGDDAELARCLRDLLGNPAKRTAFGDAGRTRARALYHVDGVIGQLHAVYENFLRARLPISA